MAWRLEGDVGRSFEILCEEECLDLLSRGWLGRVAVSIGAIPAVFPVNYCFLDGAVFFLTGDGTKLSAALRSAVVAFEIDEADLTYHQGWSVLAVGQTEEVHDPAVRAAVEDRLGPWAPGHRSHLIRIRPDFVSGRRIAFGHPVRGTSTELDEVRTHMTDRP